MTTIPIFHNAPIPADYYPLSTIMIHRGNPVAVWRGTGAYVAISKELYDEHDSDVMTIKGNTVVVCQFKLELVAYYSGGGGTYIARRIAPPMDETTPTTIDEIPF